MLNDYYGQQSHSTCDCHSCTQLRNFSGIGSLLGSQENASRVAEMAMKPPTVAELLRSPIRTAHEKARIRIGCELIEQATGQVVSRIELIPQQQQGETADSGAHS